MVRTVRPRPAPGTFASPSRPPSAARTSALGAALLVAPFVALALAVGCGDAPAERRDARASAAPALVPVVTIELDDVQPTQDDPPFEAWPAAARAGTVDDAEVDDGDGDDDDVEGLEADPEADAWGCGADLDDALEGLDPA